MKRISSFLLAGAIAFGASGFVPVRADDKKTPEQKAQEKKEKDLKKVHDDMEKELKAKKIEPAPALAMLDKLANQVGLDVNPSKDFVHKILGKKIPMEQASAAADDKYRSSVDPKTQKVDLKKFTSDFTKWINEWKAEKPADPPKAADPPAKK